MDNAPILDDLVTFDDGVTRIPGKGSLNMEGFPRLKDVLHVDGLKANLISISQMCDSNLHVNFTHDKCIVLDEFENCVLEGSRSLNNCYTLSPWHTCHNVIVNDVDDSDHDFSDFSKEKVISRLTEEVDKDVNVD